MRLFSKGTQLKFLLLYLLTQAIQFVNTGFAQTPTHLPREGKPVDFFDTTNIIVFVVLPVVIVVLYFLWRKQREKQKAQDENNNKSGSGE
jgi:heme/copper-type cytochrome/quinol oxidase subunit 2